MSVKILTSEQIESVLTSLRIDSRRLWDLAGIENIAGHKIEERKIRDKWDEKMVLISIFEKL
jgi:hypothetical protein